MYYFMITMIHVGDFQFGFFFFNIETSNTVPTILWVFITFKIIKYKNYNSKDKKLNFLLPPCLNKYYKNSFLLTTIEKNIKQDFK